MKNKRAFRLVLFMTVFASAAAFFVIYPRTAEAAFNPNYIISDFEYFNYSSLSVKGIQQFLNSQSGALKNLSFSTPSGTKTSAQIIYDASQTNRLSPKVILTTLQKEQSLITSPSRATDYILSKAMGYGYADGSTDRTWNTFYLQIMQGSKLLGDDPVDGRISRYKVGQTYNFDGQNVTIGNESTGLLYQYTPHIHGNEMFSTYWTKWFQIKYPDGTLLRAEGEPGVWLINNGKRYGFLSRIAFLSRGFQFKNIIVLPLENILAYEWGGDVQFPNLSFVQDKGGQLYFMNALTKQPVTSAVKKDLIDNGLLYEQEIIIPENTREYNALKSLATVEELSSPTKVKYPTGTLIQDISTGAIAYVKDGISHVLHSKEVLYTQFPNRTWIRVSHEEFTSFKRGPAIKLRDGTLVRSPKYGGGVFIISNGFKRPITSRAVFDGLGFKMENVIKTDDKTMDLHPTGAPFDAAH